MEATLENEKLLEAYLERQKPYWHTPVNLGIKEFKKSVRALGYPKSTQSLLIARYKRRSWMEFDSVSRGRGNFPAHTKHGTPINVNNISEETVIKVKNGRQEKE